MFPYTYWHSDMPQAETQRQSRTRKPSHVRANPRTCAQTWTRAHLRSRALTWILASASTAFSTVLSNSTWVMASLREISSWFLVDTSATSLAVVIWDSRLKQTQNKSTWSKTNFRFNTESTKYYSETQIKDHWIWSKTKGDFIPVEIWNSRLNKQKTIAVEC